MTSELEALPGWRWRPGLEALAREVVTLPGWRWMPGVAFNLRGTRGRVVEGYTTWSADMAAAVPDLSDAATLGCLLVLVREAWGEPRAAVSWVGSWWSVRANAGADLPGYAQRASRTEAAALVAALRAAPGGA